MADKDRGFASMDPNKQREIASKAGKASHAKGGAHEWTSEEAREAGRRGGMARHAKRKATEAVLNNAQFYGNAASVPTRQRPSPPLRFQRGASRGRVVRVAHSQLRGKR